VVTTTRYAGSGKSYSTNTPLRLSGRQAAYSERELELYTQCPARYCYEVIEGQRGGRDQSAYIRFHRCVYITVGWLEEERENGRTVDVASALAHLGTVWATEGPIDHAFEKYYRSAADNMVRGMAEAIAAESVTYDRKEWSIPLGSRQVTITPDRVLIESNGTIRVQRIRTGRKTKSEPDKAIYALLRRGAMLNYPGKRISVEIFYLGTGERIVVPTKNDNKLLAAYTDAIAGIERGDFHPETDARRCPNCQCYFMCGA
jgi:DNA helicase II / ATP-dependent DNA helicase PcrA